MTQTRNFKLKIYDSRIRGVGLPLKNQLVLKIKNSQGKKWEWYKKPQKESTVKWTVEEEEEHKKLFHVRAEYFPLSSCMSLCSIYCSWECSEWEAQRRRKTGNFKFKVHLHSIKMWETL